MHRSDESLSRRRAEGREADDQASRLYGQGGETNILKKFVEMERKIGLLPRINTIRGCSYGTSHSRGND
ncbi:hypothetical protein C1N76_13280 [Geobacillus thermoleovorans]|uniref:Uncharacterized protein n=1 Tax=Geobacillus thermoleovorans TaxID=33941 RepID=A0A2Z3N9R5_GEOTH|nr:hypothetical protein C1N76_13280 [Geobacillus thermoleovorans]